MKKAVFLDRDGTLIKDPGYLDKFEQIELYKNAGKALKLLKKAGYILIVLTNQSGIARGYYNEEFVRETHKKIDGMLAGNGIKPDEYYYCPHHIKGVIKKYSVKCGCRKPGPGMALKAKKKYGLDLKRSFVIGDKLTDIEMAGRINAGSVLVLTGNGKKERKKAAKKAKPDIITSDIYTAAKKIARLTEKKISGNAKTTGRRKK
ncbi:MAG: D-glycero-alpha-D-manno-heptose-1,7-bisphosphate 7-phosphatase [Candidatus Goldiibacteriota bacterium]